MFTASGGNNVIGGIIALIGVVLLVAGGRI